MYTSHQVFYIYIFKIHRLKIDDVNLKKKKTQLD